MNNLKLKIQKEIQAQITNHLVKHVQRPEDTRDRMDILYNELSAGIIKIIKRTLIIKNSKKRIYGNNR